MAAGLAGIPAWSAEQPAPPAAVHRGAHACTIEVFTEPPHHELGSVALQQGRGTPGVTQTGSHAPPHAVAEPLCHGQRPFRQDFLGS